jgi:hypothetical protein
MMTPRRKSAALLVLAATLAKASLSAQGFAVHTSNVTGGGGTSHGVGFSISGTIGEPSASTLAGDSFSVSPGYWNVVTALNEPEAPILALERHPDGSVTVSWPSTALGFVLEQSADLTPGSWVISPVSVADDGATRSVRITAPQDRIFLRLAR